MDNFENNEIDEKKVNEIGKEVKEYEKECFWNNENSDIKEIKKIIEKKVYK